MQYTIYTIQINLFSQSCEEASYLDQLDVVPLAPGPLPAPGGRHLRPQAAAGLEDAELEESDQAVQPGAGHLPVSLW